MKKTLLKKIDRAIKKIWLEQIFDEYWQDYFYNEHSLQCAFYHHLRNFLDEIFEKNNLRIYAEYYFPDLKYYADLAIVELETENTVAIIELKFTPSDAVKNDVWKLKNYLQVGGYDCQYYLGFIYEVDCVNLRWLDARQYNNWASGCVTELGAGFIDGTMTFQVNSYNGMNLDLNGW